MEERTIMETVGLICFRRCKVSLPASPSMEVSTRTRTGSKERKIRRASCSLEATVTSKFRRDKCAARYFAMATSSSTISTRVLGFIHAPSGKTAAFWLESQNRLITGTEIPIGGSYPSDIVLRFHFQVFGCLTGTFIA